MMLTGKKQFFIFLVLSAVFRSGYSQTTEIEIGYGGNTSTDVKGFLNLDSTKNLDSVTNLLTRDVNGYISEISFSNLVSSLLDTTEWIEGSKVGLTAGNIYARRALATGDTIVITSNGELGINTSNPQQALDVNGNVQHSGALMPGGNAGTSGDVLTSQGAGVAPIWQAAGSGGGNCLPAEITNELLFTGFSIPIIDCSNHCDTITQGGHADWRMPTAEEAVMLRPVAPNNTSTRRFPTLTYELSNISSSNQLRNVSVRYSDLDISEGTASNVCRCVR